MENNKPKITIYTDGACSGNPGKGGWGAILIYKSKNSEGHFNEIKKKISGHEEFTTNNKMELTAVIEALKNIKKTSNIELFTDSKYVLDGFTKWLPNWQKNGWKSSNKNKVKNIELWKELFNLSLQHSINWHWVKGHSDNNLNNEVDKLAVSETNK